MKHLYSFKVIIGVTLASVILLTYSLVFHSTSIYREVAIENQTEALELLLAIKSQDIIEQSFTAQREFANQLQMHSQFLAALNQPNPTFMEAWLVQYFAVEADANPELPLKAVVVRNLDGEVFSQASDTELLGFTGCPVLNSASDKTPEIQFKPRYTLCKHNDDFYSEVLVPVNRFNPKAYLQVLVDIAEMLKKLEDKIDLPVKILSVSGKEMFRSPQWPEPNSANHLYPAHRLFASDNLPGLEIAAAFDQQVFLNQLQRTETNFLVLTSLGNLGLVSFVVLILMFAFRPLNQLRNSMGAMLTGKYTHIDGERLPEELRDLVRAYNDSVDSLEMETISRRHSEEKLRSKKDFITTTLNSINNPVIVIDSREKIKRINPSAAVFLGEVEKKILEKPLQEMLILYSNRRTTRIVNITQAINLKQSWSTMFYHHPDGRVIELELSASPMIDMETEDIGYVIILKDVSEDRQLRRKLNYEGSHDQLTGFLNRVAFEQKFETVVVEGGSGLPQHILAFLDIDQFKTINDSCGNTAGDRLLQQIGDIIQAKVRKSDILSRQSGDEFGIIMPFLEMKRALELMQNIIIDIQHSSFEWENKEYNVTASIGVIAFGNLRDEYSDFYAKVTNACYHAKENGGNRYHVIALDDKKITAQRESVDWASDIMKGLNEDRFRLYVQPIVSMKNDDEFTQYEVLIRYRKPDGTIVSPGDFLPPAERYNLIEKIDCWVVESIVAWLQEHAESVKDKMFTINLSGRSVGSTNFHRFLKECLSASGLDLSNLCFEFTETAAVDHIDKSVEFITSIKKLGAKITLDNFGTGLSSYSYLKRFPVDYLKIDGEFIRDIIDDDKSFLFVRSMTELGHGLDMQVIAEFVESDTMFDRLRDANVDYIQGYTVGKPVSIDTLIICEPA